MSAEPSLIYLSRMPVNNHPIFDTQRPKNDAIQSPKPPKHSFICPNTEPPKSPLQVFLQGENPSRSLTNFSSIPAELVGLTLSHCDLKALRAGSLVCKDWRASTIQCLFSKIALSPATSPTFVEYLKLESGEPVRSAVQCLSLTTGSDYVDDSSFPTVESLSALLQPSFLRLSIFNSAKPTHSYRY